MLVYFLGVLTYMAETLEEPEHLHLLSVATFIDPRFKATIQPGSREIAFEEARKLNVSGAEEVDCSPPECPPGTLRSTESRLCIHSDFHA